jgi:glycosyltransferase involved in cell wall biosynthesis
MKILHIDTGKEWRGGQRQVSILHKLLLENNIDSNLICYGEGELYKKVKTSSKNIFKLTRKKSEDIHILKNLIIRLNPDIVHFHDSRSLKYINKIPKNIKKIETRRVSYEISTYSRIFKYSKCDHHVAVSNDIANYLKKYFSNVSVIHSCIELERFNSNKDTKIPFSKKFGINLLFVGSFSKQKGIDILIEAMDKLLSEFSDIGLHIVGDGKLKEQISNLVTEKKISDNVIFYGFRTDVEPFYSYSDISIIPSIDGEGSSGVIKESMASKNIVIASNLNANKELILNGIDGVLFKNGDSIDLYEKIKLVLENKIQLNPDAIDKKIIEFSCDNKVKKYINLYKQLLNQN